MSYDLYLLHTQYALDKEYYEREDELEAQAAMCSELSAESGLPYDECLEILTVVEWDMHDARRVCAMD